MPAPATPRAVAQRIGRIITVSGCNATALVESPPGAATKLRPEIGSLVKIRTPLGQVVGVVANLLSRAEIAPGRGDYVHIEMTLVGELIEQGGRLGFRRGVAHFPSIGDEVSIAGRDDLAAVYVPPDVFTIDIGTIYQDTSVSARLLADELFSKHFIIVGTTGSGKSSALCCILQRMLTNHTEAHVLVLDIHSEYKKAFGPLAEHITPDNLNLPFWLLNFQELKTVLTSPDEHYDAQQEILADAVTVAKKRYSDAQAGRMRTRVVDTSGVTPDTPTPFRLSDLSSYIDDQLGKLERPFPTLAYRKLKTRIETLATDARYAFMFGNTTIEDTMVDVLARLYRVPTAGRPITVLDLAKVPAEILDVLISLIARLTFDLGVWSDGALPLLLVCEEAHRYVPADEKKGFLPTRYALGRIAKEGRKYGISMALLTQRPSELDTTILSQCSTVIAMRLSTERDQSVMRANAHDSTFDLLSYLPLLADREAIILGQGVPMPMRIRFHDISVAGLPGKPMEGFTHRWKSPSMDRRQLEETVSRWRGQGRGRN